MARAHGKTIGLPAAEALVSRAGEQSRMLDNELKRLSQMVEGPEITLADVERLVMRTAEVKPWDFLNAVSARDLPRALELLALQPDRSEVRLFSLLVTRLRELITAKALDARGAGRELASTLGVQSWQVKNHLGWARRYKMSELIDALSAQPTSRQPSRARRFRPSPAPLGHPNLHGKIGTGTFFPLCRAS